MPLSTVAARAIVSWLRNGAVRREPEWPTALIDWQPTLVGALIVGALSAPAQVFAVE